jgi:hypothetical protein
VESNGTPAAIDKIYAKLQFKELLTIRYWQNKGNLEVWHGPRVLMVEQWGGTSYGCAPCSTAWRT